MVFGSGVSHAGYSYTTLDVPGAFKTVVRGMSGNNIVGWYDNGDNICHGFVATATPVPLPGAILLFAPSLAGLIAVKRRIKK
jgi:hypothetical protein